MPALPRSQLCPAQKVVSSWAKGDQGLLFLFIMMVCHALSHIYDFVRFASQLLSPCLHLPPVDNVIWFEPAPSSPPASVGPWLCVTVAVFLFF